MTSPQDTTTVDRRQKDGSIKHIPCPQSVSTYNTYMNGVDRGDQLQNYYSVRLKSMKYYKCFLVPVWCLHHKRVHPLLFCTDNTSSPPPLPQPNSGGPPPTQSLHSYLHLPTHTQSQQCVYCWRYHEKKHRRESVWCCIECPGHPTLCLTGKNDGSDCFRIWLVSRMQTKPHNHTSTHTHTHTSLRTFMYE